MSSRSRLAGVALVCRAAFALCPPQVHAQTSAPDQPVASAPPAGAVIVSGQITRVSAAPLGHTTSVEWFGAPWPGHSLNLGVGTFALADTRWAYGRAGAAVRLQEGMFLRAQLDAGRGHDRHGGFPYVVAQIGASRRLRAGGLVLQADDLYVNIDDTVGHAGGVGVAFRPAATVSVATAFRSSLGGRLGIHVVTTRIDRRYSRASVFGGMAAGTSRPALAGLSRSGPAQQIVNVFVGGSVALRRGTLTIAVDAQRMEESRRQTILAVWRLPL